MTARTALVSIDARADRRRCRRGVARCSSAHEVRTSGASPRSLRASSRRARPKLTPLTGAPVPAERLPRTVLPPGHHRSSSTGSLEDRGLSARGDGAAHGSRLPIARASISSSRVASAGAGNSHSRFARRPGRRHGAPLHSTAYLDVGGARAASRCRTCLTPRSGSRDRPARGHRESGGVAPHLSKRHAGREPNACRVGRVAEWVERTDPTHIRYRNERSRRSLQLIDHTS